MSCKCGKEQQDLRVLVRDLADVLVETFSELDRCLYPNHYASYFDHLRERASEVSSQLNDWISKT